MVLLATAVCLKVNLMGGFMAGPDFTRQNIKAMSLAALQKYAVTLEDRIIILEQVIGMVAENELPFKFCHFTPLESRILGMIYTQARVCTKEAILLGVWGNRPECDQPELKIVDVVICKVRGKLENFGVSLSTMWGRGYYFDEDNRAKLKALIESVPAGRIVVPAADVSKALSRKPKVAA